MDTAFFSKLYQQSRQNASPSSLEDYSAGQWWKHNYAKASDQGHDLDKLIYLSFLAPNFSVVFNIGYQFALRHLFASECPGFFKEQDLSCLCISEKGGNSPKAIETRVNDGKVSGIKTFVTCAPHVDHLLLMIDLADASGSRSSSFGKKQLRLLRIENVRELEKTGALRIDSSPPAAFLPDVDKGRLTLRCLPFHPEHLLKEADAHQAYSKPFSVLEGLYIRLAAAASLLRIAMLANADDSLQADILAQIESLRHVIEGPWQEGISQILLDAYARQMEQLLGRMDTLGKDFDEKSQALWQRDKVIFFMDMRLRPPRLAKAWQELRGD